jgi:acetoin utilization protein AcuB
MRVAEWMHKNPITVDADAPIQEAWRLMRRSRIRHLPVRDKGNLVGILTDRDLRLAFPSRASSLEPYERMERWGNVRVWEVMTRALVTAAPEMGLDEAVHLLLRFKIGGLPVVRDGKLVGILTKTDLLRALAACLRPRGKGRRRQGGT